MKMENISVSVNRTFSLEAELEQTVIEGEVVTVEVARFSQKKDQTGTIKNISGDEINALPVENVGAVVNMQAGVVNGHFRGEEILKSLTWLMGFRLMKPLVVLALQLISSLKQCKT